MVVPGSFPVGKWGKFAALFISLATLPATFCSFPSDGPSEVQIEDQDNVLLLPLLEPIGQAAGIAVNSANNLVLFHRSGRIWNENSFDSKNRFKSSVIPNETIALLDGQTGRLISGHGRGMFYMPHGLTIDHEDNYWLTDVGSHQVHKFDKSFRPLMTLGEKMVPGSDDRHFCKPTDVAVASTGEFFVADGYCNSRIIKFNKEGKVMAKFGRTNTKNPPEEGEFSTPHSLALIEDLDLLCVADRDNERIQCFSAGLSVSKHPSDAVGKFYMKAEGIGRIFSIREKEHYLVGATDSGGQNLLEPEIRIIDIITGKTNTFAKGLNNVHALAISNDGDIFVSQMEPNRIVKFSNAMSQ